MNIKLFYSPGSTPNGNASQSFTCRGYAIMQDVITFTEVKANDADKKVLDELIVPLKAVYNIAVSDVEEIGKENDTPVEEGAKK